jgi:hypothetical protein
MLLPGCSRQISSSMQWNSAVYCIISANHWRDHYLHLQCIWSRKATENAHEFPTLITTQRRARTHIYIHTYLPTYLPTYPPSTTGLEVKFLRFCHVSHVLQTSPILSLTFDWDTGYSCWFTRRSDIKTRVCASKHLTKSNRRRYSETPYGCVSSLPVRRSVSVSADPLPAAWRLTVAG